MDDFNNYEKIRKQLASNNWNLYDYQKKFLDAVHANKYRQYLLSSEIGTGKTITSFLPFFDKSLNKINTKVIYISPLKSIISILHKRLNELSESLKINCKIEKRTGDVSYTLKKKQLLKIPDIILTTPESLTLTIANSDASLLLEDADYIIIDELSEFINSKRADQLALTLSRINAINKKFLLFALSATVVNKKSLINWMSFNGKTKLIENKTKKRIKINVLCSKKIPTVGHSSYFSLDLITPIIKNKRSLIFVNTRSQAELLFKNLFMNLGDNFNLGLYHSSLSREHRIKTEKLFLENKIDAIICTSSLELGIDFDNVDQVINIGTPKSINRLIQRAGRSNHSFYGVPTSYLIPTNKFEFLECISSKELAENDKFDFYKTQTGSKDVICQHLLLLACNQGIFPIKTFQEIKRAFPYKQLKYKEFLEILSFVENGGYLLNNYKKWNKLSLSEDGAYKINSYRNRIKTLTNIGTIIDSSSFKVKLKNNKTLGTVDESFISLIKPGQAFIFCGLNLKCIKVNSEDITCEIIKRKTRKTPIYWGGNLPLNPNVSDAILKSFIKTNSYPQEIKKFINDQKNKSAVPQKDEVLFESFPFKKGRYLCVHTFMGRQTNQTLSFLIINFLKSSSIIISDYSINEYSLAIFINKDAKINLSLLNNFLKKEKADINFLDTFIAKKTFKEISQISGLIDKKKFGKKNFVNSDIIFDTLKKYEPSHILMKITEEEVKKYFSEMTHSNTLFKKKIVFKDLEIPSPFSETLIFQKEKFKTDESFIDNIFEYIETKKNGNRKKISKL